MFYPRFMVKSATVPDKTAQLIRAVRLLFSVVLRPDQITPTDSEWSRLTRTLTDGEPGQSQVTLIKEV